MQKPIKIYPGLAWPAFEDGIRLSNFIAALQRIDNGAPRDPATKQSTAAVYGLGHAGSLRIEGVETLSPAQVAEMRYERAVAALEAIVSESAPRPGIDAKPVDVRDLQRVLAELRGPVAALA